MPPEGYSAAEHGLGHPPRVEEHLRTLARREGFPLVIPDLVPNTHRALVVAELARDAGIETHLRVHSAIFDAHFGRGLDIGAADVQPQQDCTAVRGADTVSSARVGCSNRGIQSERADL